MFCFSFLGRPDNVSKPIPSSQVSQVACEHALQRGWGGGKEGELATTSLEVDSALKKSMQNADWRR